MAVDLWNSAALGRKSSQSSCTFNFTAIQSDGFVWSLAEVLLKLQKLLLLAESETWSYSSVFAPAQDALSAFCKLWVASKSRVNSTLMMPASVMILELPTTFDALEVCLQVVKKQLKCNSDVNSNKLTSPQLFFNNTSAGANNTCMGKKCYNSHFFSLH